MAFINPLDLDEILVNQLAGNLVIFGFLMFFTLSFLAAKFKMPNIVFISLFALFIIYIFAATGKMFELYVVVVILAVGGAILGIKRILS